VTLILFAAGNQKVVRIRTSAKEDQKGIVGFGSIWIQM
jgi:hypothetical protein